MINERICVLVADWLRTEEKTCATHKFPKLLVRHYSSSNV